MSDTITIGRDYRGRYRVISKLGEGATSCVYRLYDPWLSRDVVLKKGVPSERYTKDTLRDIFANEDAVLDRLKGTVAPSRYEFLPDELELYMEYRPGRTLDTYLEQWISEKCFWSDDKLLQLMLLILEKVQVCHRAGVIIADLKPRNIQVGSGETDSALSVTLLDFGSAWMIGSSSRGADYSAGYGAPELLRGEIPSPASDLYSVGAILFALFARREPSLYVRPRDFADRRTLVLPALQDLVLRLTDDDPGRRPKVEEALRSLRACADDLADLALAAGTQCPRCQRPVPEASARYCRHCGAALARETRVLSEETGAPGRVNPVARMIECERAGELLNAVFWAKQALRANLLSLRYQVQALEIALRVPTEFDFASQLATSISYQDLREETARRKYLVCLGQVLMKRGDPFGPYRARFEQAVQDWPQEELLWCWLYLASDSDPARQEEVLRQGLRHHPESEKIRYYLGRVLQQRGARHEALATWVEAVQKGQRELRFVRAVYELARELRDDSRSEVLREIILSCQPSTPQEALELAHFAVKEGRGARALEVIDQGLSQDPHNPDLRRCKAKVLFAQRKYELVLELDWVKAAGDDPFLRTLKGRCFYELGHFAQAAQEMVAVITKGYGTAETWFYLVRCYQRLGKANHARTALSQALRAFPDDQRLRRLAEVACQ
ncbi:MAG: hypothetical protein KatS3mg109_0437 [Pirellulaceae bacterium]|nr:MAG: hypothetical protein KatS3mg109_0437 [Pirellulaceae bacterium]